jgi:mRNA interferase RelE/StbE
LTFAGKWTIIEPETHKKTSTEDDVMKIRYSKNAMKFLNKLDKRSVLRIVAGIEGLTLKPPAGDIKVMQGLKDGTMRLRVGSWRVLYRYGEENALEILLVLDIWKRGDIYK